METKTIVMIDAETTSRHAFARTLAPTARTFQGIAVPTSGYLGRLRPATAGIDLRSRTP